MKAHDFWFRVLIQTIIKAQLPRLEYHAEILDKKLRHQRC